MEPKDMTNEQFAAAVAKRCAFNPEGPTMTELRRRLDEADALRDTIEMYKEVLDFYQATSESNADKLDALRKENEELRKDKERLDCLESICPNGNVGDIRCFGTWRMTIDDAAHLAKESEASHE